MYKSYKGQINRNKIIQVLEASSKELDAQTIASIAGVDITCTRNHLYNLVREERVTEIEQTRYFGRIPRQVRFYRLSI